MAYFKINGIDFSMYVNKLKVGIEHKYKGRTNASGNTLVKYTNTKRIIEVGIIPLDDTSVSALLAELNKFEVKVTFLNPTTKALETIDCIIPQTSVDYYTIKAGGVMLNAFSLKFTEL